MPINAISDLYGVSKYYIHLQLSKWGIVLRKHREASRRKEEKIEIWIHYKRQFSEAFLVRQRVNTEVNNRKIKYVNFEHSTDDQKLVEHLLMLPIIG